MVGCKGSYTWQVAARGHSVCLLAQWLVVWLTQFTC